MRRLLPHLLLGLALASPSPLIADPPAESPKPAGEMAARETGPIAQLIALARAQLPMFGFQRHEAEIDGRRFVWWQSTGQPNDPDATEADGAEASSPVVMLHGVADQAATWMLVAPTIAEGREVYLVDLPGHGESEPSTGPLKMSTIVAGLESWLGAHVRADERPVVLVGNSMGAWLATVLAHRHPSWVEKAVLINGGPLAPETGDLDLMPSTRDEAKALMAAVRDPSSPSTPDAMLDDLVARVDGGEVERMFAENDDLESHLLTGRLSEVETPVHLLWGTSDRFLGADYPKKLLAGLPDATFTAVPSCGHLPQVECPRTLAPLLLEILN